MKSTLRRAFGVAILLTGGACVGSASSISYYVDVFSTLTTTGTLCPGGVCPNSSTATLNNGTASNVTLTLPQFNQLGNVAEGTPSANHIFALTSVALSLDWKLVGTASAISFYTSDPTPVTSLAFNSIKAFTDMTLTAGGTQVVAQGQASTGSGTVSTTNVSVGPPIWSGRFDSSTLTNSSSNSQNAANLAFFQGLGANNFSAGVQTNAITGTGSSSDPNAPGHLFWGGQGQMGAIMTITYNYTEQAIPEPGTMALMGSALIGLAVVVRKRVAKH